MDGYFKGLPKDRRTKGTKFYYGRSQIALITISVAVALGFALHFSPAFQKASRFMKDGNLDLTDEQKKLKLKLLIDPKTAVQPKPTD